MAYILRGKLTDTIMIFLTSEMTITTNMSKMLWKTRKTGIKNLAFHKDRRTLRHFTEEEIFEVDYFRFDLFQSKCF